MDFDAYGLVTSEREMEMGEIDNIDVKNSEFDDNNIIKSNWDDNNTRLRMIIRGYK